MALDRSYKQLKALEPREAPTPKRPLLAVLCILPLLLLLLLLFLHLRLRGDTEGTEGIEGIGDTGDIAGTKGTGDTGDTEGTKDTAGTAGTNDTCGDSCRIVLVESIPEGLHFSSIPNPSTFSSWRRLLRGAERSVEIAALYFSLSNAATRTHEPSAQEGEEILAELLQLSQRGVSVRVAVSVPSAAAPLDDLRALELSGAAVRTVDLPRLTGGVLHTKFWIVDGAHLYLGSANMDWRSLTQVKELGAAIYNCSCLAQDLGKIFEAYWALGVPGASIPAPWPDSFSTAFNASAPLRLRLNGTAAAVYFSSSPPALCPSGRSHDLSALLSVIDAARESVDVAVMSYVAGTEFSRPERFWPAIDERLRRAAVERGVRLRLLAGCWPHSRAAMFPFLRSLAALADERARYRIQVRLFLVPSSEAQARIPFARVNHDKYMVTEQAAYVGTSNWSGDYFERTAGSALVLAQPGAGAASFRERLQAAFERDWSSDYSVDIGDTESWAGLCGPR